MKNILITGGTGFIGSHTAVDLINNNYNVTIVDNLENSNIDILTKIELITGKKPVFHKVDLCDKKKLDDVFNSSKFDGVIHFAGLKAVGESIQKPLEYYQNNLMSSLNLLDIMTKHGVNNFIFSSSATVYGAQKATEFFEDMQIGIGITNPYGQTKAMIEQIIQDFALANPSFKATILRYANPIGAHESGLIGENPSGIPNNLLPFIAQVAAEQRDFLNIFGDDYPTPDGTCIRDYIHVVDLASGHLAALKQLNQTATANDNNLKIYNLGSGKGESVLEIVAAFESATGVKIPYKIAPRRDGDLSEYYENSELAFKELGWKTKKTVTDACRDLWNFQKNL